MPEGGMETRDDKFVLTGAFVRHVGMTDVRQQE